MNNKKIFLNIFTILFVLIIFPSISQAEEIEDGKVRFLHVSPDITQIDITVDDDTIVEGLDADPSMERIPSEMPATGMGGAQSFKDESTILGVILIFLIMVTSFFMVFRQQPWNNNSKN